MPPPTLEEQIETIDAHLHALRTSFANDGETHIHLAIERLEATRRILVWAQFHPAAAAIGLRLTREQRAELQALEAASLAAEPDSISQYRLREKEFELGVYDDLAYSPRWQD